MKKYEYETLYEPCDAELMIFGEEGWELCGTVKRNESHYFYFKRELPAPVEEVEEIEELNETSIYEKVDELLNELVPDLASKVKIKSLVVGYTNRINQLVREFNKLQKGV